METYIDAPQELRNFLSYHETVIRMVGKGLGLSMMAEMMLRGRTAGVQVVPISPATGRELGMGMHMKESVPDGILHLRECVLAFIGTL